MAGRPKIFDTEEVIAKATEVFWARGYEAASTEELLAAMGIGKGSFYLAFKGGKKELYEKVLERFSREALNRFRKELAASSDPIAAIRALFLSIASTTKRVHQKGCIFGNTIAELSNSDVLLMEKAVHLLQELEEIFCQAIRTAQESGRLQNREQPELLARNLITLWNGLGITRRMYPDNKVLSAIIDMQLQFLR